MARTFASTGRSMKNFEIIEWPPPRHCEERSDAAIQSVRDASRAILDCFASLAMTAASLFHRRRGALFGIDLLAGNGAHDAADHHAIILGKAFIDDAQVADQLARLDLALLDDIVLVDHENITAGLIGAERDVGHQQRPL